MLLDLNHVNHYINVIKEDLNLTKKGNTTTIMFLFVAPIEK